MIPILIRLIVICAFGAIAMTSAQTVRSALWFSGEADPLKQQNSTVGQQWLLAIPDLKDPQDETYAATLTRPVFFSGRAFPVHPAPAPAPQPAIPEAEPADVPPPPQTIDGIKLKGVQWSKDGWRVLIEIRDQPAQWFETGQDVGGWHIERIEAGNVALCSGQGAIVLELYSNKSIN